jgi:hypothetical protein
MMTIDEAIKHCDKKAESLRAGADVYKSQKRKTDCLACAEEHEQLARWLRELKWRREAEEQ